MEPIVFANYHLIKSEDLNHHGTLYAGRSAEWFVEAGFTAVAAMTRPENVVCLQIHGMTFKQPLRLGEVACYESRVVLAGRTKLVTHIQVIRNKEKIVDGFITFIHVDKDGRSSPHGIEITPLTAEDIELQQRAEALFK